MASISTNVSLKAMLSQSVSVLTENRGPYVIFMLSVTVHINNAVVIFCNLEWHCLAHCTVLWKDLTLITPAFRVRRGSSQILSEVQQEERHRRRWGERPRIPNPSGSSSVGRWWRTAPKRGPELLWGSTSASPLLRTEECKRRIMLLPSPAQNTRLLILWLTCTSVCVLITCIRHPKPTPNSMSAGTGVKVAASRIFWCDKLGLV